MWTIMRNIIINIIISFLCVCVCVAYWPLSSYCSVVYFLAYSQGTLRERITSVLLRQEGDSQDTLHGSCQSTGNFHNCIYMRQLPAVEVFVVFINRFPVLVNVTSCNLKSTIIFKITRINLTTMF